MLIYKILFVSIIFSFSVASHGDDDFSKEVIKATPLTTSLYMLEGAGGNMTASIGPDGVLLVDDDFAEMAERLVAKLKELKGGSPRYIINTHFHYDHTGGNNVFGRTATIIAATEVRDRLASVQKLWNKDHPAYEERALPLLTYDHSLMLHLNHEDVRVIHLPHGHTDGDTVVFFTKDKVVSLGDLYFSGMYPIFHPEHDGSFDGFIQHIKFVLEQISDDTQIIAGHGPLSKKTDLEKYYKMLLATRDSVKAGIKKGFTLEQIQKAGLSHDWDSFSHGYLTTDKWITLVYKSLRHQ